MINQLASGVFDTRERLFAFCTAEDGKVRLAEFSADMPNDILPDSSEKEIEWQILSRASTMGEEAENKTVEKAWATLRKVHGDISWEVFAKSDESSWQEWHSGCASGTNDLSLEKGVIRDMMVKFGSPPIDSKTGRKFQMLLKMTGHGALESVKMTAREDRGGTSNPTGENCCVVLLEEQCADKTYDPFSYAKSDG